MHTTSSRVPAILDCIIYRALPMKLVTVVILLLLVPIVRSTVAAFRPVFSDETEADMEEGATLEDRKVSECFGKLRAACSLNQRFSDAIDRYARTLRVDKLRETIERKVQAICNEAEKDVTVPLLKKELSHSAAIVKQLVHNLPDFDRDRLNMWANLNDSNSERNFFLEKIKSLPPADIECLTTSMNAVITRFVNGEPPKYINELTRSITEEDKQQLSIPSTTFEKAVDNLFEKLGMPTDDEDLRLFMSGISKMSDDMLEL